MELGERCAEPLADDAPEICLLTTVLITGAAGYVGSGLAARLLQQGYGVRGLVRDDDDAGRVPGQVELVRGSVTSEADMERAARDVCAIVNCAVVMPDRGAQRSWHEYDATNTEGSKMVLRIAARHGVNRAVLLSTAGVLRADPRTGRCDDGSPLRTGFNHYLRSKIAFETWLSTEGRHVFGRWVVLRPSSIFGPGPSFKWPQVMHLVRTGRAVMLSDGRWTHPLVHVADLIEAIVAALVRPLSDVQGQRITITSAERVTVRDVLEAVRDELGEGQVRRVPWWLALTASYGVLLVPSSLRSERLSLLTPGNVREYCTDRIYDVSKAERLLGFRAAIAWRDGLREMMQRYRQEAEGKGSHAIETRGRHGRLVGDRSGARDTTGA